MKNLAVEELKKKLNWKEKIILLLFKKVCIKIYKIGLEKGFNTAL